MTIPSRPQGRLFTPLRGLFVVGLCLAAWSLVVLAGPGSPGRAGGERQKKRVEEEKDDAKPKKRIEEEEDDKPKKRKVVRVDETEEKTDRPTGESGDLGTAAREAKNPLVKALFLSLAVPNDEVKLLNSARITMGGRPIRGAVVHVEPLPDYVSDPQTFEGKVTLKIIHPPSTKVEQTETLGGRIIDWIHYYEQTAVKEVKVFRAQTLTRYPQDDAKYLPRYDQLLAAEQALSAVVRFHQSARERGLRKGDAWDALAGQLREELLDVLLAQLNELVEAKSWDQAFALTRRMAETYTRPADHARIAQPLAGLLNRALKDPLFSEERMKEAQQRLGQLEDQFPGSKLLEPIRNNLREQAKELFEQAKELVKRDQKVEAQAKLRQAEEAWPELPGLRAFRIATDASYPIVRISVRELPKYLSPALAATDSERRCVELLFESLVQLQADDQGVMYYRPALAVGRPRVLPLGRQFKLPRNARWSNGEPMTANDLRYTVGLLQDGQGTGRAAGWGDLLTKVHVGGDPFRVDLMLRQGFLDPLAPMSFKVLPARARPQPTSPQFAEKPISSGPFQFDGHKSEAGREYVGLRANPFYGVRRDKKGLPRVKEVRFFAPKNPVEALKDKHVDAAFDLTGKQMDELLKAGFAASPSPDPAPNRRICFLAVNHRRAGLANAELRVALARAINREQLLDDSFRKGLERKVHRAVNGPYPAGSWACNPGLVSRKDKASLDPFDDALARSKEKQALAKLGLREVRLTVKYPSGDEQLTGAMTALCEQVNKTLTGVRLTPEERPPHDLREDVEQTHSYDLAYYSYDFPDESFWLLPLLGPSGPGGSENYLGYNGPLVGKIQAATTLRHFSQVREYAHAIHQQMLDSEMPFIPLWQLDPLYAYRQGLNAVRLDPYRVFQPESN